MTGHQWGEQAERAFVEWIKAGHGFVVFHAAAATSQDWPEFQQLVHLTWGIDKTAHGAYHTLKVTVRDNQPPDHARDAGFLDHRRTVAQHGQPDRPGDTRVVPSVFGTGLRGTGKFEPVVVPTALGRGRGLNIVLGHDVHAMQNVGWQTLMLRGLEWAATGDVTIPIPDNWPHTAAAAVVTDLDLPAAIAGSRRLSRRPGTRAAGDGPAMGGVCQFCSTGRSARRRGEDLADRLADSAGSRCRTRGQELRVRSAGRGGWRCTRGGDRDVPG